MNNNINKSQNDFKVENMKQVEINGELIPFSFMKNDSMMTESKEIGLIGYSKVYYIDGKKYESLTPIKFYK